MLHDPNASGLSSLVAIAAVAGGAAARARVPIRVDVSALTMMDQVLTRNFLRQISARRDFDFIAVSGGNAEVSIDYVGDLVRVCAGAEREMLPHPLRITQLDPVLQRLAPHTGVVVHDSATMPGTVSELLLPSITFPGPLRVSGVGFGDLYFDKCYRFAWSAMAPEDLLQSLVTSQAIEHIEPSRADELDRLSAKDGLLRPVSIESLCWAMDTRAALAGAGGECAPGDDCLLRLSSWPNLAWLPDFEAWLPVLMMAFMAPVSLGSLRQRLIAKGIAPARVAEKLQLLVIFRRLERASGEMSLEAPIEAPASAPTSILGRLRARLRAIVSA